MMDPRPPEFDDEDYLDVLARYNTGTLDEDARDLIQARIDRGDFHGGVRTAIQTLVDDAELDEADLADSMRLERQVDALNEGCEDDPDGGWTVDPWMQDAGDTPDEHRIFSWRGFDGHESRTRWFNRLWDDVCALRLRYALPVRTRWWEDELRTEALAAMAAWVARYDDGEWEDPPGKLTLLFELERLETLLRDGNDPFHPARDRPDFDRYVALTAGIRLS